MEFSHWQVGGSLSNLRVSQQWIPTMGPTVGGSLPLHSYQMLALGAPHPRHSIYVTDTVLKQGPPNPTLN